MLKSCIRKIAVTGGLSSGKSSVCRFFRELGACVVSADEIVHQLLSPETNLGQKVIQLIGTDLLVEQKIDRSRIAKKVFSQPQLLHELENLLHPAVREEIEKQYRKTEQQEIAPIFVVEIPLLFESMHLNKMDFDYVITVLADTMICKKRYAMSTGYASDEFDKRMSRQISPQEKAERADIVIENNGTLDELKQAVKKVFYTLIGSANNL
jgi:dephospho-CoA kinase